jgi:hypothetical protein
MTMIRKQFFIDRDASARLKRAAATRGVSEAELIREGIERVVGDVEVEGNDWRKVLRDAVEAIPAGQFDELAEHVAENRRRRAITSKARRERNWARRDSE